MCNRLDTIPACDGRTDILPRHCPRYAYASRGKNEGGHVLFGNMIIKYTEKGGLLWEEA